MLLTSNRIINPATEMARAASTKNARIFSCPEVSNSKRSTLQHSARQCLDQVRVRTAQSLLSHLHPLCTAPPRLPDNPPTRLLLAGCSLE